MRSEKFDVDRIKTYWLTEAKEALQVADHLVEKADYSYALFFGHLAIEKMLKALYAARVLEHAPPIHNLLRLARGTGVRASRCKTPCARQLASRVAWVRPDSMTPRATIAGNM